MQYPSSAKAAAAAHGTVQSPLLGMAAVSGACLLSGLAGVWLERIVKRTADVPVWVRNVQLGLVSLIIGLGSVWSLDGHAIRAAGFFQGYTWVVVSVVLQVSAGGLLVGLIMRYADNVIKGFATSLSIILSSVLSSFIPAFDFAPSPTVIAGSTLVILATILYSSQQEAGGSSTSSSAAQFEKGSAGMFERAAKAHDWRPIRDDFASSAHAQSEWRRAQRRHRVNVTRAVSTHESCVMISVKHSINSQTGASSSGWVALSPPSPPPTRRPLSPPPPRHNRFR